MDIVHSSQTACGTGERILWSSDWQGGYRELCSFAPTRLRHSVALGDRRLSTPRWLRWHSWPDNPDFPVFRRFDATTLRLRKN